MEEALCSLEAGPDEVQFLVHIFSKKVKEGLIRGQTQLVQQLTIFQRAKLQRRLPSIAIPGLIHNVPHQAMDVA